MAAKRKPMPCVQSDASCRLDRLFGNLHAPREVNQLCHDSHVVLGLADAAFQDRFHIQAFSDDAEINVLALEGKGRSSCCHTQLVNLRQGVDDFLGDPIGEELILSALILVNGNTAIDA
jgi:hypothetical protein